MDPGFWQTWWREGRIEFHEGAPNGLLVRHAGALGTGRRVLVPLCGKARDLAFLAAQGHQVVGVELVESAAQAFFAEHGATPVVAQEDPFTRYTAGPITLLVGDFFATTPELLGPLDALYDRAAIIALPPALRAPYARHVRGLLPAGSPGLIINMEYPQEKMRGPPFSVPEAELRAHYDGLSLERLDERKVEGPRFAAFAAVERCFAIRF
jgi:thiopurine S-methyltransferase